MKVLFLGSLPDPVTGQSLACRVLLDALINQDHQVEVVDLSKDGLSSGISSISRIKQVLYILKKVNRKKNNVDVVYLTISESVLGNLKDILIYLICFKSISKLIIHLHGGSIKRLLFDKYPFLYSINKFFIKKMGAVVVLGESHIEIFSGMISQNKIHIVPNFAEDYLFLGNQTIRDKFKDMSVINLLFLSNIMYEKGFSELLDAFLCLPDYQRTRFKLTFAGAFESEVIEQEFFQKIKGVNEIDYHGIVNGIKKAELLFGSHVFCLPTNYLEGQPISILEAYAAGCCVVTTSKGGIPDIFRPDVNGYEILPKSSESIVMVLSKIYEERSKLESIAINNNILAYNRFRVVSFNERLINQMKNVIVKEESK